MSPQDVRADDVDVAEKRITNEHVRGMVANSPTMDTLMETRRCRWLQTQCNGRVKISENAWRMVYDGRVGRPQQTIRHAYIISQEARLWRERAAKGMDDRRDRSAWGRKVEYKLELPPGSFTNLRRHWTKHERHIDKIGLDRRFNGKKSTTSFRDTRQN
jgi:hypothetical protein